MSDSIIYPLIRQIIKSQQNMKEEYTNLRPIGPNNYQNLGSPAYLYEPLRNALRKYTEYPQQQYTHNPDNFLKHSKVAKTSRSLSSSEAENIKASIAFPHNKTLIPTKNFQKIHGKTFIAVNVEQRMKDPISYREFLRVKTDGIQQIVYQIQEEDQMNKVFTYTTNTTRNTLPKLDSQFSRARLNNLKSGQKLQSHFQTNFKVKGGHIPYQNANTNTKDQTKFAQLQTYQSKGQDNDIRPSSKVQAHPYQMPSFVDTLPRRFSYSYNQDQNELVFQPSHVKPYKFNKQKMKTQIAMQQPQVIQNKLNLFSMFDECGNNGCKRQGWRTNEICASRVTKAYWK